jgi:chromosome segregation ATPase
MLDDSREPRRAATTRQLPDLIRGLLGDDLDARDAATEELGRRLRGDDGTRLARYLRTVGQTASDADGAERISRLNRLQSSLEQIAEFRNRAMELRDRGRRLGGQLTSWERYREDAGPSTPAGTWMIENLDRIEMHIGMLRGRIDQLAQDRDQLEQQVARTLEALSELPGTAEDEG